MLSRLRHRLLVRKTAKAADAYLGGFAAYAEECARKRAEAGILCPQGTPGCPYTDCGPWEGYSCGGPNAPRHMDMGL